MNVDKLSLFSFFLNFSLFVELLIKCLWRAREFSEKKLSNRGLNFFMENIIYMHAYFRLLGWMYLI